MPRLPDVDPLVVGISWRESIHLELNVVVTDRPTGPLSFALSDGERRFDLDAEPQGGGVHRISINVATFRDRQELPDGEWALVPLTDDVPGRPARLQLDLAQRLADASRVFMREGDGEALTVAFALAGDETRPELRIRSFALSRATAATGAVRVRGLLRRGALRTLKLALAVVYRVARATRSTGRSTILFASEQRAELGGNLAAVHDRLLARGLDERFDIRRHTWIADNRDIPTRLAQTALIARADYLVIDDFFPGLDLLRLDPTTTVVQAWHAGVGFKAVGYARFGDTGPAPRETSHRSYTWAIAGSTSLRSTYADVFGIEPEAVLPTGLPRVDGFLDEGRREAALTAFAEAHPETAGRRLVLFAPTYRGQGIHDAHYDYDRIDFAALHEWCGADTVIGFRMHHFVTAPAPIPPEFADRFIDLTHYPDGLGLLHSAELLITDYSSIIYEYSLLDRPMLFYAYDRDAYAATRGFQQDYDTTTPGKVCLNSGELLAALRDGDFEPEKAARFRERYFDRIDTGSSDRFIDWFLLGEMPEEFRRR